ncbi:MAG: hypothetical protein D6727_04450 [Gammaproteobacteria bacterium]|nr:MAG: hypothetical protein D6727_04450 [Gammaproteobacteria bacterium]
MRLLAALLGLACGCLTGLLLLAANLPARFDTPFTLSSDNLTRLDERGTVARGMSASALDLLGLEANGPAAFGDPALRHARLALSLLQPDSGGAPALGVKLSASSADNSLLRGRLFADSAWSVAWPGHGSLFLVGYDDYWPLLADSLAALLRSGRLEPRPGAYLLSGRRRPTRFQGVVGASGALAEFAGRYREWLVVGDAGRSGYLEIEPHSR